MDLLSAMEAFARVFETGSFSAAAKRMRIGQPAVSKLVSQLEEHLGAKLLLRSTRGLAPTDTGKRFYEHALRTMESAELAQRAARGEDGALTGRLRVSATITFMRRLVIPELSTFFTAHPSVQLDLLLDDGDIGLIEEGIDVALRMGKLASSGFTARKIGQSRRLVVASAKYFREHGEPRHPEDLVAHPTLIYTRREGGEHVTFTRGNRKQSVTLQPRVRVNAMEGLLAAILADLGVAIATEWVLGSELAEGRVKVALSDWQLPSIELWAVFPEGRQANAKARAFVAFVEKQLAATPFAIRTPQGSR